MPMARQAPFRAAGPHVGAPGVGEGGRERPFQAAVRVAGLLLPEGDAVQHHSQEAGALHHLDQPKLAERRQQKPEDHRRRHGADEQHHAEERHHLGPRAFRRQIGGQGQASGLRHVQARAGEQERQRRAGLADDRRPVAVARKQDQREGHDRQAAELQHGAEPDVGHPLPAQHRAMGVRSMAHQHPEWGEHQGQGDHHRHEPGGQA